MSLCAVCAASIKRCLCVFSFFNNTRGYNVAHCIIKHLLISNPGWLIKCQFSAHHDLFPVVGCRRSVCSRSVLKHKLYFWERCHPSAGYGTLCYDKLLAAVMPIYLNNSHRCPSTCTNWHQCGPGPLLFKQTSTEKQEPFEFNETDGYKTCFHVALDMFALF